MSFPNSPFGFLSPEQSAEINVSTIGVGPSNQFRDVDTDGTPWTFDVILTFKNDGSLTYTRVIDGNGTIASQWLTSAPDPTNAALYEIACTENATSGAATRTGDTSGTYFGLGTSRTWQITSATSGDKTWALDFIIRDVATQTQQGTATLTLELIDGFT